MANSILFNKRSTKLDDYLYDEFISFVEKKNHEKNNDYSNPKEYPSKKQSLTNRTYTPDLIIIKPKQKNHPILSSLSNFEYSEDLKPAGNNNLSKKHERQKSLDKANKIIQKTQKRYKYKKNNDEEKFNELIKDFMSLDTFCNVKNLLQQMNLTNKIDAVEKSLPKLEKHDKHKIYLTKDLNDSDINENKKDENNYCLTKSVENCLRKKKLELNKKNMERNYSIEEINNQLQYSSRITEHLNEEIKRKADCYFEKSLIEDFERKLLILQNQKTHNISKSQDLKSNSNYLRFEQNKIKENLLRNQLQTGLYLKKFRKESIKVINVLKKTTEKIFSSRVTDINDRLTAKNRRNFCSEKKSEIPYSNIMDIIAKENNKKYNINEYFKKEYQFQKELTSKNKRLSKQSSIEKSLPNENLQKKLKIPTLNLQPFKSKNSATLTKIKNLIYHCDELKQSNLSEKSKNLKGINKIQKIINNGFESLQKPPQILESLLTTITKDENFYFPKTLKNRKKPYLKISEILG